MKNKKIATVFLYSMVTLSGANAVDFSSMITSALESQAQKYLSDLGGGLLNQLFGKGNGSAELNKILLDNGMQFCSFKPFDFGFNGNFGSDGICSLANKAKSEMSKLCSFIPGMTTGSDMRNNSISDALSDLCEISKNPFKDVPTAQGLSVFEALGLSKLGKSDEKLPNGKTIEETSTDLTAEKKLKNSLVKNFYTSGDAKAINYFNRQAMAKGGTPIDKVTEETLKDAMPKDYAEKSKQIADGSRSVAGVINTGSLAKFSEVVNGETSDAKDGKEANEKVKEKIEQGVVDGLPYIDAAQKAAALEAQVVADMVCGTPALQTEDEIKDLRDPHLRTKARSDALIAQECVSYFLGRGLAQASKKESLSKLLGSSIGLSKQDYIADGYKKSDVDELIATVKEVTGGGGQELGLPSDGGGGLLDGLGGIGDLASAVMSGDIMSIAGSLGSMVTGGKLDANMLSQIASGDFSSLASLGMDIAGIKGGDALMGAAKGLIDGGTSFFGAISTGGSGDGGGAVAVAGSNSSESSK